MAQKLLVEGTNDLHVIASLCDKHNLPKTFDIENCGGIENLLQKIEVQLNTPNLQTLGVVVDADNDVAKRWTEVKKAVETVEPRYQLPGIIPPNGYITPAPPVPPKLPKLGIWIMPDNQQSGALEKLVLTLIPPNDSLYPIVETTLDSLENQGLNRYDANTKRPKAAIYTWLAWQTEPGSLMGRSIADRSLHHDSFMAGQFVDWLRQLFEVEENL